MNLTLTTYLGDNCIVFENFTASIGNLMPGRELSLLSILMEH
jgi:hypothetical protein